MKPKEPLSLGIAYPASDVGYLKAKATSVFSVLYIFSVYSPYWSIGTIKSCLLVANPVPGFTVTTLLM